MVMIFSKNAVNSKQNAYFTPSQVNLNEEAINIAMTDGNLFDQALQLSQSNYTLAQDQSILAALNSAQNQRIAKALSEKPQTNKLR